MEKKWIILPIILVLLIWGCNNQGPPEPSDSPPSAPSGLTAVGVSSNQINLGWADNSEDENGFRIERAASSDGSFQDIGQVGMDTNNFTDDNLPASTNYWYRVRAYNDHGFSDYSNVATAATENLPTYTILYKVSGTGPVTNSAFIAYSDQNGNTQQIDSTALPWELTIESTERPRAYVVSATGATSYLEPVTITA